MATARKSVPRDDKAPRKSATDRADSLSEHPNVLPPHSPNDRKSADSVFRGVAGRPPEAEYSDEAVAAAEHARPDLPDENEDGLDELTAEVQRQAERGPVGVDGREEEPETDSEEDVR